MANVLFTRKNASEIPNVPIIDGQLIFDTSGNGKMYLDNGTDRLVMGGALTVDATLSKTSTNPVQNRAVAGVMLDTLSDIRNVTSKGFLTDALAVKELNTNVNELNNSLVNNVIKYIDINATTDSYGAIQLNLDDYPMLSHNKFINAICYTEMYYVGRVGYLKSSNCFEIRIVIWNGTYEQAGNISVSLRLLYTDNMIQN